MIWSDNFFDYGKLEYKFKEYYSEGLICKEEFTDCVD